MPNYLDIIEANKFQTAHESDIFPLPIVAIALGIGRNKMSQIPVIPIMINKRKCYRKRDILNWAIAEQSKGKENLLLKLRAENSKIGTYEKTKSKVYDYFYSKSDGSYYRPSRAKGETNRDKYYRLEKEWRDIYNELTECTNNENLKSLVSLAWSYREQFIRLRMGLPRGIGLGRWWFEKDFEKLTAARLTSRRESLRWQINMNQDWLDSKEYMNHAMLKNDLDRSKFFESELKMEIEQLKAELKELG